MKEHVLHLVRHLAARHSVLVGEEIDVAGAPGQTAFIGNGLFPDGEAHLLAAEYQKAEEIGRTLYCPFVVQRTCVSTSPLPRTKETLTPLFTGMATKFAEERLRINLQNISPEEKKTLSDAGLHKWADYKVLGGLAESVYRNSNGEPDNGNELVAQAYCKTINPNFSGYRWMVQKGFEQDPRSEHPKQIGERALIELIPNLMKYELMIGTTHQPNLEIITAALGGDLGQDANELFEKAGGAYGMGGRLELRIYTQFDNIVSGTLKRSLADPKKLEMELPVNINVLRTYI
jgi:hypothetical protein